MNGVEARLCSELCIPETAPLMSMKRQSAVRRTIIRAVGFLYIEIKIIGHMLYLHLPRVPTSIFLTNLEFPRLTITERGHRTFSFRSQLFHFGITVIT